MSILGVIGKLTAICGFMGAVFGELLVVFGTVDLGSALLNYGVVGCIVGVIIYALDKGIS